jgi:DNA-binding GntR family transcriptional regulator
VKDFDTGEPSLYFERNQTFHQKLVEMTGNVVLIDMHALLSRHVRRPRIEGVRQHLPTRVVIDEHKAILKALLARDGDAAQAAAEEHLKRVAQTVVTYFRMR